MVRPRAVRAARCGMTLLVGILVATALLGLAASLVQGHFNFGLCAVVAVFGAGLGLLMARWDDLVSLLRV